MKETQSTRTVIRHIAMLRVIRLSHGGIIKRFEAGYVYQRMKEQGFTATRRTIERDLITLVGICGLCREKDGNGQNWWFRTESLEPPESVL